MPSAFRAPRRGSRGLPGMETATSPRLEPNHGCSRLRRGAHRFMLLIVSRGPTRRVEELIASGAVSNELLRAADHEADLLAHPYTGVENLELARLRLTGRDAERDTLRRELGVGVPTRWWRRRGRRSALRRRGLEQTEAARLAAERAERRHADS